MVKASKITKVYETKTVLDSLSFSLKNGEILGLIGPNGAGKSTAINIITGALAPTAGSVKIEGFDIQEEPRQARALIGYLPEKVPLYPKMTVLEYLNFCASIKKIKNKNNAIKDVLEETGLEQVKHQLTGTLSKGYKQRTGLAQAFLGNPKLIVLDEPASGLDPRQLIEMRNLIFEKRQNCTIILSSHSLQEVQSVCSSILILDKGKTQAKGTADDLANNTKKIISLTVVSSKEDIQKAIKVEGLSEPVFIENQTTTKENEQKKYKLELEWNGEEIVKEKLIKNLLNAHISILNFNVNSNNLEKLFMQLTEDTNVDNL